MNCGVIPGVSKYQGSIAELKMLDSVMEDNTLRGTAPPVASGDCVSFWRLSDAPAVSVASGDVASSTVDAAGLLLLAFTFDFFFFGAATVGLLLTMLAIALRYKLLNAVTRVIPYVCGGPPFLRNNRLYGSSSVSSPISLL